MTDRSAINRAGAQKIPPAERKLRARLAAQSRHAKYSADEALAPARAGFLSSFERQVDPERLLSPEERHRRAELARKAHYSRLGLLSAKARRARRGDAESS